MTAPVELHDAATVVGRVISSSDTVKLGLVRAPTDEHDTSVFFEVWAPGGAQPPNSHPASVETFWFLRGEGVAVSDGVEMQVRAGQFLVLPAGSEHHIRNTGSERLYAITTMAPDAGFAALVAAGPVDDFDDDDRAVLRGTSHANGVRPRLRDANGV